MKSVLSWLSRLTITALFVIPLWYFFRQMADSAFRDNAMGNWFATMVGIIVGIPIALEINRRQQQAQEQRGKETLIHEELGRKAKILKLLKDELQYNRTGLLERQPTKEGETQRKVFVKRLKDELWNAFSDGGELQWIRDLQLLDFIATAYYKIRITIYLEERYFEATHFPGMQIAQKKYPKDYIMEYLIKTDSEVIQSIEQALAEIDKALTAVDGANRCRAGSSVI